MFFIFQNIMSIEKPFVVIVPSFNNEVWYEKNLDSLFTQNYSNYRVIYIDDCSTDGTKQLVEKYFNEHNLWGKCTFIHNEKNCGALHNYYRAIHSCADDEIVVTVDGDDWLAHKNVLKKLNECYQEEDIWLTYGQFKYSKTGNQEYNGKYSKKVIKENQFRSIKWKASHLRTFYAGLFKKIALKDLLFHGKFASVAWDIFFMLPMLEMAGKHHRCIREVLYVYNNENSLSDFIQKPFEQIYLDLWIRNKQCYEPLEKLFSEVDKNKVETVSVFLFLENDQCVESIKKDGTAIVKDCSIIVHRNNKKEYENNNVRALGSSFKELYRCNGWQGNQEIIDLIGKAQGDYILLLKQAPKKFELYKKWLFYFFSYLKKTQSTILYIKEKRDENNFLAISVFNFKPVVYTVNHYASPLSMIFLGGCIGCLCKKDFLYGIIKKSNYGFANFYALLAVIESHLDYSDVVLTVID